MPERAILAIVECSCECGHSWTEQELIFRENASYSYSLDDERYRRVVTRAIRVEGTRSSKRRTPLCYRCVDAPYSEMGWTDGAEHPYYEGFAIPDNRPRREVRSLGKPASRREAEDAEIDKLLNGDF